MNGLSSDSASIALEQRRRPWSPRLRHVLSGAAVALAIWCTPAAARALAPDTVVVWFPGSYSCCTCPTTVKVGVITTHAGPVPAAAVTYRFTGNTALNNQGWIATPMLGAGQAWQTTQSVTFTAAGTYTLGAQTGAWQGNVINVAYSSPSSKLVVQCGGTPNPVQKVPGSGAIPR